MSQAMRLLPHTEPLILTAVASVSPSVGSTRTPPPAPSHLPHPAQTHSGDSKATILAVRGTIPQHDVYEQAHARGRRCRCAVMSLPRLF